MPFYELTLILRPNLPKKEVVECLKRAAKLIWNENGVLTKIEYFGYEKLPYQTRSKLDEGVKYNEGSRFVYHLSLPQLSWPAIRPELKLDVDITRAAHNLANESALPKDYECTLEEELRSPFFRKSVQPLLENKNVLAEPRRAHQIQAD